MIPARIALAAIGLILTLVAAGAWVNQGGLNGTMLQQLLVVWTTPWGASGLLQLCVSFALTALLILFTERSWRVGLLLCLPVLLIGHAWTALWLALRLPRLATQLSR